MSTPIINPWIIYLISLCHNLKFISIIAICITVVAVVIIGLSCGFEEYDCCDKEDAKAMLARYIEAVKEYNTSLLRKSNDKDDIEIETVIAE